VLLDGLNTTISLHPVAVNEKNFWRTPIFLLGSLDVAICHA